MIFPRFCRQQLYMVSLFIYTSYHIVDIFCPHHFRPWTFPTLTTHSIYALSASFSKPSKLILFGRSIGSPSARSQTSCASGPSPRETPNVAV